jgi:PAS domain-containing protein
MSDVITYWNRGAQELHGWTSEEEIGTRAHELLQSVFPAPIDAIRELGIFWAIINQPPPGSIKRY